MTPWLVLLLKSKVYFMKKILITGVAGFIGSHVANRFLHEGYSVVGVDDLSSGKLENVPKGLEFIQGDLALSSTIKRLPKDCNKILHLAGQSSGEVSFDDPVADLEKNTVSTLNLIIYGIEYKIERLVYASSMSVYGAVPNKLISEGFDCKPLSCYGVGKLTSEGYLRIYQKKLPSVCLRMFNVYGPGQPEHFLIPTIINQVLQHREITLLDLNPKRDYIFIDDVVEAWFRASTYSLALGQTLNLGTGVKTTVGQLLDRVCEIVPGSNYFIQGSTPGDQSGIFADVTMLKKCLGIKSFTPLDIGLKNFADWARKSKFIYN